AHSRAEVRILSSHKYHQPSSPAEELFQGSSNSIPGLSLYPGGDYYHLEAGRLQHLAESVLNGVKAKGGKGSQEDDGRIAPLTGKIALQVLQPFRRLELCRSLGLL